MTLNESSDRATRWRLGRRTPRSRVEYGRCDRGRRRLSWRCGRSHGRCRWGSPTDPRVGPGRSWSALGGTILLPGGGHWTRLGHPMIGCPTPSTERATLTAWPPPPALRPRRPHREPTSYRPVPSTPSGRPSRPRSWPAHPQPPCRHPDQRRSAPCPGR